MRVDLIDHELWEAQALYQRKYQVPDMRVAHQGRDYNIGIQNNPHHNPSFFAAEALSRSLISSTSRAVSLLFFANRSKSSKSWSFFSMACRATSVQRISG